MWDCGNETMTTMGMIMKTSGAVTAVAGYKMTSVVALPSVATKVQWGCR